jgi:FkbM family methyltransferase
MLIANLMAKRGFHPKGIVHVGAHKAQEMPWYLMLQPEIIIWIEADPARGDEIQHAIDHATGSTRQYRFEALIGDEDDRAMNFHRFNNEGQSSSVFPSTRALAEKWPGLAETGEVISLVMRRLDSLLTAAGFGPEQISAITFDVQGAEMMALRGAGEFLDAAQYIEVEVSTEAYYEGAPLFSDIEEFLTARGFTRLTDIIASHMDVVYGREK